MIMLSSVHTGQVSVRADPQSMKNLLLEVFLSPSSLAPSSIYYLANLYLNEEMGEGESRVEVGKFQVMMRGTSMINEIQHGMPRKK
jgi:hypothetical protein